MPISLYCLSHLHYVTFYFVV